MTNQIVAQTDITIEQVDALEAAHTAAVAARTAAYHLSMARPNSLQAVKNLKAALEAETVAKAAWKAARAALEAQWLATDALEDTDEERYLCERYDAMDNAIDYPEHYDASMPVPYQITSAGYTYLDHHYATDSEVDMLADGGDSPYGDSSTGYVQPTPAHPCYVNGVADMDALSRYEDLSY